MLVKTQVKASFIMQKGRKEYKYGGSPIFLYKHE